MAQFDTDGRPTLSGMGELTRLEQRRTIAAVEEYAGAELDRLKQVSLANVEAAQGVLDIVRGGFTELVQFCIEQEQHVMEFCRMGDSQAEGTAGSRSKSGEERAKHRAKVRMFELRDKMAESTEKLYGVKESLDVIAANAPKKGVGSLRIGVGTRVGADPKADYENFVAVEAGGGG